ncbi:hypothetical protein EBU71_13750 [bacterium]|nr:hypothetical protein [Candidatus Elulimicrobium humile]
MAVFIKNFYSSAQQYDKLFERAFDEGPRIYDTSIGINSSSIGTSDIDQYRQGVEITQETHTLGMYKISAGTPGHIIKPECYGVNNLEIISTGSFVEIDYFNPVDYLYLQGPGVNFSKAVTFPIITSDANQVENYILNGIIEPLTIRPVISFFSIEFPYESHAFRADMMAGNQEQFKFASDRVLTVDYTPKKLVPLKNLISGTISTRAFVNNEIYLDAFEVIRSGSSVARQNVGYLDYQHNYVDSFNDTTPVDYLKAIGITEATHGTDMVNVFQVMTGSTDNYIPPGKKSATSGFVYDNIGYAGTDSIAFGGMTY